MVTPLSIHGVIQNERNLKMRSPRPMEGRARNYLIPRIVERRSLAGSDRCLQTTKFLH